MSDANGYEAVALPGGRSVKLRALTARQAMDLAKANKGEDTADAEFAYISASVAEPPMTPDDVGNLPLRDFRVLQKRVKDLNGLGESDLPLPATPERG